MGAAIDQSRLAPVETPATQSKPEASQSPSFPPAVAKLMFHERLDDAASLRSLPKEEITRLRNLTDPIQIQAESTRLEELNNKVDKARHQIQEAFDSGFISRTQRAAIDTLPPGQRIIEGALIEKARNAHQSSANVPGLPKGEPDELQGKRDADKYLADIYGRAGVAVPTPSTTTLPKTPAEWGASILSNSTKSAKILAGMIHELRETFPERAKELNQIEKINDPAQQYRTLSQALVLWETERISGAANSNPRR